jgi:hypothetical protein
MTAALIGEKMRWLLAMLLVSILGAPAAADDLDRPGDLYEIRLERVTESSSNESSGSSHDVWTLRERVVALRDGGVELEFDLPADTSPEDRARAWQYPARVFRRADGSLELLNAPELEARVAAWLERFGIPETACGQWTFTWTAIKIECDPQSVLASVAAFDLRVSDLRDGGLYRNAAARGPAQWREARGPNGRAFVAEMEIDPDVVRRARADQDVVIGEIMREPITLEAALQNWDAKQISGTITTTFETDSQGRVMRRTQVANILIVDQDGSQERQTTTEVVERRLVPLAAPTP